MNLKDYLRIFRRRLVWFIGTFVLVFGLIMAYFLLTQKPVYTAGTRVVIDAPSYISLVQQIPQRGYMTPTTQATWQNLITATAVKERALKRVRQQYPNFQDSWLGTVGSTVEQGTSIVRIEAKGSTREEAAALANAVAVEAADFSADLANTHVNESMKNAKEQLEADKVSLEAKKKDLQELREKARSEDPKGDAERMRDELRDGEGKIRQLHRKIAAGKLKLDRIQVDRKAAQHLSLEVIPQDYNPTRWRIENHPSVRSLSEELERLIRDESAAARRYASHHETRRKLKDQIAEKRAALYLARQDAVGRELDHEEMNVLSEIQDAEIEIKALKASQTQLRGALEEISDPLRRYLQAEKEAQDLQTRLDTLNNVLTTLKGLGKAPGYIRLLPSEEAKPGGAAAGASQAGKFWPMGLLISLVFGGAVAYIREMMDTTLRTDYDIKRHLNLPVLTDIPEVAQGDLMILNAAEGSFMTEKFDTLATILQTGDRPVKTVLVTSSVPEEGKTTVSVNLAIAFARQGRRTLLIDGDMRVPSVHNFFRLNNTAGFSDLLLGTVAMEPDQPFLQEAGLPNLHVCVSGTKPENPYALLDPQRIEVVMEAAKQHYDVVVLDSPPILRTGDALKIAALTDTTLMVIEAGRTDTREATWAKRLLENVSAKLCGVLLNKAGGAREQYYYYYSYYAYRPRSERTA